jgi:crotonobetainyl-CoA:carnitine CoA-transferase CaiB-like acyl-CoA transferase
LGTPGGVTRRSPLLGEHTDDVLAEFGFSPEDIEALRADSVVI